MSRNRLVAAAAAAAAATAVIVTVCVVPHHGAAAAPVSSPVASDAAYAVHVATAKTATAKASTAKAGTAKAGTAKASTARTAAKTDPAVLWMVSAGGQAQATFNQAVDVLAGDLETEAHAPTVANHLAFEADARVVRAEARTILHTPALLPHHNRAAYKRMLNDFITVANLLQPGPGYGTTDQDYAAWWKALNASNIEVW
jgi:hypothetical protein